MLMLLVLAGCSLPWGKVPGEPARSRDAQLNTVAAADLGDRLNVTASVAAVLAERAFVVNASGLSDPGLLVLAPTATDVSPPDVVAVDGTVRQFSFERFRVPFGLSQPAAYAPYEGRKVLVAAEVRSLA